MVQWRSLLLSFMVDNHQSIQCNMSRSSCCILLPGSFPVHFTAAISSFSNSHW
jgi:hypothetical protein